MTQSVVVVFRVMPDRVTPSYHEITRPICSEVGSFLPSTWRVDVVLVVFSSSLPSLLSLHDQNSAIHFGGWITHRV